MQRTLAECRLLAVLMMVSCLPLLRAQGTAPQVQAQSQPAQNVQRAPAPTGSVSGTVMASDTQRPARFVQVVLTPVPTGSYDDRGRGGFGGGGTNARTGVDGTFTMPQVPAGDYYVMASAVGYVSERAIAQAMANSGADPSSVMAKIPVVHVSAQSASTVTVTIERGGAVAGKVQWEDGSAASGVMMSVVAVAKQVALPDALNSLRSFGGGPGVNATTDDRGAFRITGLAPGDYYVQATIEQRSALGGQGFGGPGGRMTSTTVHVYSPNVFRKSEARPVTVTTGDDRSDVQMVLDFGRLHAVSGHVTSSNPGQTVASGSVTLTDATDGTLSMTSQIAADGSFNVPFVPAGTYTLSVPNAGTTVQTYTRGGGGRGNTAGSSASVFQPLSMSLSVSDTDVSGLTLALAPAGTQQSSNQ